MSKHTPGADDKAANLSLRLTADSGYSASSEHRVSANQWGAICIAAEDGKRALQMLAARELLAAAECEEAMNLPANEARKVLERHGWKHEARYELDASQFVARLRRAAIAKATGGAA